jgi:hypothetical protein
VTRLEQQIEQLEEELDTKTRELRQLRRALSRYDELLELTGVKDREAQESGAAKLLSTVMQLPYLSAVTATGRAGELQRLSERLERPRRETPGQDVPKHLRPANFGRSVANRQEAEALWEDAQQLAAEAIADGLLSEAEWQRWSGPASGLSLESLVEQLEHLECVPLFVEELRAEVVATVEGALVPAGFLERVQAQMQRVVATFKESTRLVPSDWSVELWSVIGVGFQCVETPWEQKGLTQAEWESAGELERALLKDRGIDRNFWHGNGAYLTECLLNGRREELRAFAQEGLDANEIEEAYEIHLQEGGPVVELLAA